MANANAFQKEINPNLSQNLPLSKYQTGKRESFSRASHFALILLPIMVGVWSTSILGFLSRHSSPSQTALFTGAMGAVLRQDNSIGFQLFVFGLYALELGGAIGVLFLIGRLEDWETKSKKE